MVDLYFILSIGAYFCSTATIFGGNINNKMYTSLIIFCSAMLLIHGVSCNRYKAAILKAVDKIQSHSKVTKGDTRQDDNADACIENEIASADLSDQCIQELLALENLNLDFDNAPQASLNAVFSVICNPECGQPIFDAFQECDAFDDSPGVFNFLIGLCGTQANGSKCYSSLVDGENSLETEGDCYEDYDEDGTCTCRSELQDIVNEQGCCLDIYHDLVQAITDEEGVDIDFSGFFEACDTDLPGGCNNSPISSSVALVSTTAAVVIALMLSIALVLG